MRAMAMTTNNYFFLFALDIYAQLLAMVVKVVHGKAARCLEGNGRVSLHALNQQHFVELIFHESFV